jgi:predicted secreted protein
MFGIALTLVMLSGSPAAVQQPAPAATTAPVDPDQRVRCKSEEVTGSLAGRRRVCRTVGEWRRIADAAVQGAQQMVDHGTVSCGECRRD